MGFHLLYGGRVFQLNLECACTASLTSQLTLGIAILSSSKVLELQVGCHSRLAFARVPEIRTLVFMLERQVLYLLNHLPAPHTLLYGEIATL